MFPPIEPFDAGYLDAGDAQRLWVERSGRPDGEPVVVLHGGPGSGLSRSIAQFFDPDRWLVIQFDQRGAGRSTPHASDPGYNLTSNTTKHLIADIETIRMHLDVSKWVVTGGSWGSTLGLTYAQAHPARVRAMVLWAIATTTEAEVSWITRGVRAFFPAAWAQFQSGVPADQRDGDMAAAYRRLLMDPDPVVHHRAARNWCDWEAAIVAMHPDAEPHPNFADPRFCLGFARLVAHYFENRAWLASDQLIIGMQGLRGIPGAMIHGAMDLGCPPATAWHLHRAWSGSTLRLVPGAGHRGTDHGLATEIIGAIARVPRT